MSARVDLSTKREREIPGNTAQPLSAPSAIDSLRYPEMSPDAKGWLLRFVTKNYLSQDELNQLDPKQRDVYNQFLALDKAVSDFIDLASTVAFKERIGRKPEDWQARISHANSVVQAKLLELWRAW